MQGSSDEWFTLLHLDGLFTLLSCDLAQKIFKYAFADPKNAGREPENTGSRHIGFVEAKLAIQRYSDGPSATLKLCGLLSLMWTGPICPV